MRLLTRPSLRPAGFDDLGLRQALAGRILPCLVAAMAFLAALSLGGAMGASALARHWRLGAGAALTIQVPNPAAGGPRTRLDQALIILRATPGFAAARALSEEELADLLRPWLGRDAERIALPLPGVIDVRLAPGAVIPHDLAARLRAAVPGTMIENHGPWLDRLSALAGSLQASAVLVLILIVGVAIGVIVIATRAGLSARREAIEIIHGLGATDSFIAARFASRTTWLAALGGLIGSMFSLPVLAGLAGLAQALASAPGTDMPQAIPDGTPGGTLGGIQNLAFLAALPPVFWLLLPGLPCATGFIGWLTTQITVRGWLRRLP